MRRQNRIERDLPKLKFRAKIVDPTIDLEEEDFIDDYDRK
jgi:hypothetical protein